MKNKTDNCEENRVRMDKWLWAARFYKTRALAVQAVEAGQVRIDDERIKPSRIIRIGDRLTIRKEGMVWKITVQQLSERRLSAQLAAALYSEDEESRAERELFITQRKANTAPRFPGRPTKRDRRVLEDFLNES